jgi:hypothetical protein
MEIIAAILENIAFSLLACVCASLIGFVMGFYCWIFVKGFKTGYKLMNNWWEK